MSSWKDVLAAMTPERALERTHSMVAQGTVYKLGRGGFRPDKPLWSDGKTCDCSGFVAWALGFPREFPPGSGHWLQTTTYWEGGGYPQTLFAARPLAEAMPGDLLVFPDHAGRQGHIGIVTDCANQQPTRVAHCSSGNFRQTGDAIRATAPAVLLGNPRVRLMRVDFDALRRVAGIAEPPDEETVPFPNAALRSLTLAQDPTLRLVASGMLVLEPTGEPAGGVAALRRALERVEGSSDGSSRSVRGATGVNELATFDEQTVKALKAFQRRVSLEPTGELDAATLRALDTVLLGGVVPASRTSSRGVRAVRAVPAAGAAAAAAAPLAFAVRQEGTQFFARAGDQPEFLVGRRVTFRGLIGLTNTSGSGGAAYAAKDHVGEFGHWAHLIEPTAMAEGSGFFDRHNTYDRARFTFGFLQFAAHNPESDFVLMLRGLLALPLAPAYFPDLSLIDGRVTGPVNGRTRPLETATSTALLMDYLNPSSQKVDEPEALNCAKFVHWCAADPLHRAVQVKVGVEKLRKDTKTNHKRYNLDRRSDVTCALIFDIHHQGRASVAKVRAALENAATEEGAWEELLAIGLPAFKERVATLKKHFAALVSAGVLGKRTYSAERHDFV